MYIYIYIYIYLVFSEGLVYSSTSNLKITEVKPKKAKKKKKILSITDFPKMVPLTPSAR